MANLAEVYRPKTWDRFVGHDRTVKMIRFLLASGNAGGDAWIFEGPSGVGKTAAAQIAAREFTGGPAIAVQELDGDKADVEAVRGIVDSWCLSWIFGKGRAVIVNEAHEMTPRARAAWLTGLERIPADALVIFTTMEDPDVAFGADARALLGRMKRFRFSSQGLADPFAARAMTIAKERGLDGGRTLDQFRRLVQDSKNSLREALAVIGKGEFLDFGDGPRKAA